MQVRSQLSWIPLAVAAALVADLEVASLWISGSNDQVMEPGDVRHLAGYSGQHELMELNNCGHLPMQTHAGPLKQHLTDWLARQR